MIELPDIHGLRWVDLNLPTIIVTASNVFEFNMANMFPYVEVPIIDHPDARIYQALTEQDGILNMDDYHYCDTEHCIAGWLIHICGEQGYDLARQLTTRPAATLIYRMSCPDKGMPEFNSWYQIDDNGFNNSFTKSEYDKHHFELLRQRAEADPLP